MYMVPNRKSKTTFGMQPPPTVHRFMASDVNLEAIFNSNFNFILKLYNIKVEVEDGLQIKIGDQKSMYHRGGCMPKVVLDFRLGTIYMVNLQLTHEPEISRLSVKRTKSNTVEKCT